MPNPLAASAVIGTTLLSLSLVLISVSAVTADTYLFTVSLSNNLPITVTVESASLVVVDRGGEPIASAVLLDTPVDLGQGTHTLDLSVTRYIPDYLLYGYAPDYEFEVRPTVCAKWGPVPFTFSIPFTVTAGELQEALRGVS